MLPIGSVSAYDIGPQVWNRPHTLDDFHLIRRIGKGGFATVYLVRFKSSTGRYWALKCLRKAELVRVKQEHQIINEKRVLSQVRHPFIVEMFQTFQNATHLFMILEYVAGGDLFTFLRQMKFFEERVARFYAAETLLAIEYLHSMGIIYRDLKPENILLDTTGHIKLADFGFAKVIHDTTASFCGTPDYIAPEMIRSVPYDKSVDWWSFGVLIFELISGKTPFEDDSSDKIYHKIRDGHINWHPRIGPEPRLLISGLLQLNPHQRLGYRGDGAAIKKGPWLNALDWHVVEARGMTPPHIPTVPPPISMEHDSAHETGQKADEFRQDVVTLRCSPPRNPSADPFGNVFNGFDV